VVRDFVFLLTTLAYGLAFVAFGLVICLRTVVFAFRLVINGSSDSRSKKIKINR
jgi:hypothetical protein